MRSCSTFLQSGYVDGREVREHRVSTGTYRHGILVRSGFFGGLEGSMPGTPGETATLFLAAMNNNLFLGELLGALNSTSGDVRKCVT